MLRPQCSDWPASLSECLASALILLAACGEQGTTPIARFTIDPPWLCEGDATQRVLLDAGPSLDARGESSAALDFAWALKPEPAERIRGDVDAEQLVVRFAADRPVQSRLTVTEAGHPPGERNRVLGITRTTATACALDADCAPRERCVTRAGERLCVDDEVCVGDDDCGCLRCRPDDDGAWRCVPA